MYKYFKSTIFIIAITIFINNTYCAKEGEGYENFGHESLCLTNKTKVMPRFEESISFSGSAFYYFYQLGVAAYLQENYDLSKVRFLGSSAGVLSSIFLACDINIREFVIAQWIPLVYESLKEKTTGVYFNIFATMKSLASILLEDNSYKKVSGRIRFPLVSIDSWYPKVEYIDAFSSNEELIEAAFAAAHLPFIVDGYPFATFNNKKYIDGGFADYQPVFDENTIKISRYMWSYLYGAWYSPLSWLSWFGNTSKKRNLVLFNDGYEDAKKHVKHWERLERFRK